MNIQDDKSINYFLLYVQTFRSKQNRYPRLAVYTTLFTLTLVAKFSYDP